MGGEKNQRGRGGANLNLKCIRSVHYSDKTD